MTIPVLLYNVSDMYKHTFTPKGVCSRQIDLTLTAENLVEELVFTGGCPGNTIGISKLVKGMDINKVIELLEGTDCRGKGTSCPDQLAVALTNLA